VAQTGQTGQGTPSRFNWRDDFRMNTLDIVVAVLLGIIEAAIEIVGALGFLERTVWATGSAGFVIYAIYNGTTWILFFAGAYLRKKASVLFLAIVVTHVVRWFMGDPDGPLLLWYAIAPGICTVLAFYAMRWRGKNSLFAVTGAVAAGTNQVALFVVVGFGLAGGAGWGLLSIVVGAIGGLLWGVIGRYLGIGLEKAGVPSVDVPPSRGGAAAYA
jgi:ABC-type thiamin/hydroxymethylpyrimidine transport system permease subunit